MQNEYTKKLQEMILNRQPIKVFIDGEDFGMFEYNKEKNIYQGKIGALDMKTIANVLDGKDDVEHIKIQLIEQ